MKKRRTKLRTMISGNGLAERRALLHDVKRWESRLRRWWRAYIVFWSDGKPSPGGPPKDTPLEALTNLRVMLEGDFIAMKKRRTKPYKGKTK